MLNSVGAQKARARETQRQRHKRDRYTQRPLSMGVRDNGKRYSESEKAQALTLWQLNLPQFQTATAIGQYLNITPQIVRKWLRDAKEMGWEGREAQPGTDGVRILKHFVEAGKGSGRPREISYEEEQKILEVLSDDRASREQSSSVFAYRTGWSATSVRKFLKKHGYHSVKPTTKPGLSQDTRKRQLAFTLEHQHWTLEDWKNSLD
jgi:hypothetical protein